MSALMNEQTHAPRFEPRWPVALAILAVLFLLAGMPGRVRLLPHWITYAIGVAVLASVAVAWLTAGKAPWLRVERMGVLVFFVVKATANLATLAYLIDVMISRSAAEIGGLQLLESSTAVWVTNVLVFSLLYWQIDRGGPGGRAGPPKSRPDWLFPQQGAPAEDAPPAWRPTFVDYLYLGFSTATAFSTTDAMPLTARAKLLMMLESAISLLTIVVVASRAINILGS